MIRRGFVLAGVLAMIGIGSLPGFADPPEHCVVEAVAQRADGELVLTDPVCFSAFADAAGYASGGLLALRSEAGLDDVSAAGGIRTLSGSFALGIHYDGSNGTGSSITVMGSSCTGGWWNTTVTWVNRISSSYNGCYRLTHHDGPNRAGTSESTYGVGSTSNLTTLNNLAESVSYWSS